MNRVRVVLIEDDPKIAVSVEKALTLGSRDYALVAVGDPVKALPEALRTKPDLILLDINLPGTDGRAILKSLKLNASTRDIPVIFLTGFSSEADKVLGLNLGADDYVPKPFGAMELVARIEAVLRRAGSAAAAPGERVSRSKSSKGLRIDPESRQAFFNGKLLALQPREFEILSLLAGRPGRAFTRSYILENTSSSGRESSSRALDTHIKNIRMKLGPAGRKLIETVPKTGYRLRDAR